MDLLYVHINHICYPIADFCLETFSSEPPKDEQRRQSTRDYFLLSLRDPAYDGRYI